MNRAEAAMLLGICTAYDRRTVADEDAIAWAAALDDIGFVEARDAVVAHYRAERSWMMPADVRRLVRLARRAVRTAIQEPIPPAALADDPHGVIGWGKAFWRAIHAGADVDRARAAACHQLGVTDDAPAISDPERIRQIVAAATQRGIEE